MPTGTGIITRTVANGPYAYTWDVNANGGNPDGVDTVVTGKTLAQAYNEIGTLAGAIPGTAQNVRIIVTVT